MGAAENYIHIYTGYICIYTYICLRKFEKQLKNFFSCSFDLDAENKKQFSAAGNYQR